MWLSSVSTPAPASRSRSCECGCLLHASARARIELRAMLVRFREMLLELAVTIEICRKHHPNIATFLGAVVKFPAEKESQSEWSIGLVFELCDPYDLYHLLHNHKIKLTPRQKIQLVRESASGLAHIHSLNIIHRDFGSRNILIKDRHAKITDFGIARQIPNDHTQYQPSSISGTLQWMAPEQIGGKILSPLSDVFGLGTVLWEILTETVPFSDVQDPLKPDMPALRDALNLRCVFRFRDILRVELLACLH